MPTVRLTTEDEQRLIAQGATVRYAQVRPPAHLPSGAGSTEAAFTREVIAFARQHGWRVAHFRPARTQAGRWVTAVQGDGKGFLDIVAVRGERIVVAELKVGKNRLTPEQLAWLNVWSATPAEVYVWRPAQWPEIHRVLGGFAS